MKILINNKEQDNVKAIQVADYWVVVDLKTKGKNNGDGYYYDEFEFACPLITKYYESDEIQPTEYKIMASTKFIDKSIPVIKFVEPSVEELAEMQYPLAIWTEEQSLIRKLAFKKGYSQAKSFDKKWSDEDLRNSIMSAMIKLGLFLENTENISTGKLVLKHEEIMTNLIQSLNQPKLPDVINLEMEEYGHYEQDVEDFIVHGLRLKTTSTPEGKVIYINI